MSSEEFHSDLISRLDPEIVAKALEVYSKKSHKLETYTEDGKSPNISSKVDNPTGATTILFPETENNVAASRYLIPILRNNSYLLLEDL